LGTGLIDKGPKNSQCHDNLWNHARSPGEMPWLLICMQDDPDSMNLTMQGHVKTAHCTWWWFGVAMILESVISLLMVFVVIYHFFTGGV
jgi:hypothetical protein